MNVLGARQTNIISTVNVVLIIFLSLSSPLLATTTSRTPSLQITIAPVSMSFGSVALGSSGQLPAVVTNTGASSILVTRLSVPSGYSVSGLAVNTQLEPGQGVPIVVKFSPSTAGLISGKVMVTGTGTQKRGKSSSSASISVSGTGIATTQLTPSPFSVSFGSVQTGATSTQTVTLSNTGSANLSVSQVSASGTGFSVVTGTLPVSLAPGQSTALSVKFSPTASGSATGNIAVVNSGATVNVALSGTGVTPGVLSLSSTSLGFGSVQVGLSKSMTDTLTNTGGSSLTVSQATVSGTGYSVSGVIFPLTLQPSQSASMVVTFAPQSTGSIPGGVTLSSTATAAPIALSGTGTSQGQLAATPTSLSFGNVVVGASSTLSGALSASGSSVTVSSASSTDSEFTISGLSFPITLTPGQSAAYTVTFKPAATGTASGNLSFASNATSNPSVSLAGAGATAPSHSVALNWSADASAIAGYNVYRGTASGGPYVQINSLAPNPGYTDSSVQTGATYYYVVTAVGSTGQESAYSNQVKAVIPTP